MGIPRLFSLKVPGKSNLQYEGTTAYKREAGTRMTCAAIETKPLYLENRDNFKAQVPLTVIKGGMVELKGLMYPR